MKIIRYLKHIIFPESCPVCGAISVSYCEECLASCVSKNSAFCSDCGGAWKKSACPGAFPCYYASIYESDAKKFIINLKYRNSRSLGIPMGQTMTSVMPFTEADCIVPVPLHINSDRAYNQTELLAIGMSQEWNIPVENILEWTVHTGRQVEKKARLRQSLPLNSITCHDAAGRKVLLVDDVYTTGSTLRVAAEAVRKAGGEVSGAYFWSKTLRIADGREWSDILDGLSLEIRR